MHAPISLIILTYNEEENIRYTLECVEGWIDKVIIVDSFSSDSTINICEEFTDMIYQNPFENQAKQFNWALDNVPFLNEWILRLDSDELVPQELAQEICETLPSLPEDVTGIYLRRQVHFMGRWMRRGGYYPMWFLRLFKNGRGRYEEITEEHIVLTEGRTVRMKNDFIDCNRKGLTFWVDKHNNWAIGEMLDTMAASGEARMPEGTVESKLFGTQEQRKRWLKMKVYGRVPLFFRAFLYFIYRYFIRLGFLDGREGFIFHFLQGFWYRFLVDAKIYEARKFGTQVALANREYTKTKPWED